MFGKEPPALHTVGLDAETQVVLKLVLFSLNVSLRGVIEIIWLGTSTACLYLQIIEQCFFPGKNFGGQTAVSRNRGGDLVGPKIQGG